MRVIILLNEVSSGKSKSEVNGTAGCVCDTLNRGANSCNIDICCVKRASCNNGLVHSSRNRRTQDTYTRCPDLALRTLTVFLCGSQ